AFLLRPVFRVRTDVDDFLRIAELVDDAIAFVEEIVEVADNRAEVLASRDRAPAANRVEADRNRTFGQQGRRVVGTDLVWMIDAEDHERNAVRRALSIFPRALADRELIRANRMFRTAIA